MKYVKVLGVILAVGAFAAAGLKTHGCGGYGPPDDPLVMAALSDNTVEAHKAVQELRKLGNAGIERLRFYKSGTLMHVRRLNSRIEGFARVLETDAAKLTPAQLDSYRKRLVQMRQERQSFEGFALKIDQLMKELSRASGVTVAGLLAPPGLGRVFTEVAIRPDEAAIR